VVAIIGIMDALSSAMRMVMEYEALGDVMRGTHFLREGVEMNQHPTAVYDERRSR